GAGEAHAGLTLAARGAGGAVLLEAAVFGLAVLAPRVAAVTCAGAGAFRIGGAQRDADVVGGDGVSVDVGAGVAHPAAARGAQARAVAQRGAGVVGAANHAAAPVAVDGGALGAGAGVGVVAIGEAVRRF